MVYRIYTSSNMVDPKIFMTYEILQTCCCFNGLLSKESDMGTTVRYKLTYIKNLTTDLITFTAHSQTVYFHDIYIKDSSNSSTLND